MKGGCQRRGPGVKLIQSGHRPRLFYIHECSTDCLTFITTGGPVLRTLYSAMPMCKSRGMLSVDNCRWRLVVYTEHEFHLIRCFMLSLKILVLILKLVFKKRLPTQTVASFKMTMCPPNIMKFWHNMLHDITG